jgi:uncharacterized protein (DUF2336 family)
LEELESAVEGGSAEKRIATLRRLTDLFLDSPDRLTDAQIEVFDDILCYLVSAIEARSLIDVSKRLAPVDNAPIRTIGQLARNDEIEVAAPILSVSPRLTVADLVEIAGSKGQGHLLAISGRPELSEEVTDVLLARGNQEVAHKIASNSTASLSQAGFGRLIEASKHDATLAAKTGSRLDLPRRLLRDLFMKTTAAGRALLLSIAPEQTREELHKTLYPTANEPDRSARDYDFAGAEKAVDALRKTAPLKEADLLNFAKAQRYGETVVTLALLCAMPLELTKPLMLSNRDDGVLVACKAAGFGWQTVHAILQLKAVSTGQQKTRTTAQDFAKLSKERAQRIMEYWQARPA